MISNPGRRPLPRVENPASIRCCVSRSIDMRRAGRGSAAVSERIATAQAALYSRLAVALSSRRSTSSRAPAFAQPGADQCPQLNGVDQVGVGIDARSRWSSALFRSVFRVSSAIP